MQLIRRRSARDEHGAVTILVAVSLVALCMAGAMAIDVGNVAQLHRHAQATVDDAAISGADLLEQGTHSLTDIVSATETYIDENWGTLPSSAWGTCPSVPAGFSAPVGSSENCITFNASETAVSVVFPPQSVPFTLARLGGFTSGSFEAAATAVLEPGTSPCALCLLGATGPKGPTLYDNGSGSFTVTDGPGTQNAGIIVNSSGTPAAQIVGGSGSITVPPTAEIGVVGTYSPTQVGATGQFSPTPKTGVTPVPDPLGGLVAPVPSPATIPSATFSANNGTVTLPTNPNTYGSINIGGSSNVTIPPGNYSSINVTGGATLTLESGTYFISGAFSVGGNTDTGISQVNENIGVLLYFTCSSGSAIAACASGASGGSLSLNGTANVDLAPQTTGPYANLTVFYDRNNTAPLSLAGTPGLLFSGTVYAKSSDLTLNGHGQTFSSMFIVNSATVSGNSPVTVNYDASQNVAPPGVPYLCSTTANNC